MYLLKLYENQRFVYEDKSEAQKIVFTKLVFCKNKTELKKYLYGYFGTLNVFLAENIEFYALCETDDKPRAFFKGAVIYGFNNSRIKDYETKEIRYNLGCWWKNAAIKYAIERIGIL